MTDQTTMNKNVFFSSFIFILILTGIASIWPSELGEFFKSLQTIIVAKTGWIYVVMVGTILFLCLWLIASRLGDIKLGPDHIDPEYGNISWFAMLFSAGMGIGLMFYGVAEPLMHFSSPPLGDPGTIASAKEAMKITFFHWGLHAWAVYAFLAVVLAYFCYRKDLPLLPRSTFHPFIGDKIYGPIGDTIDSFAIIGTMFGVATSLGLGVTQVNAGLSYLMGIEQSATNQVILIAAITAMATVSVVLGLDGGIKKLSNINVILAVALMGTILLMGNTVELLQAYVQNTGAYLSDIIYKTFNLYAYEKKESWIGGWTLLYWAWWISWSPFVGMFIARISKGRTIRQFMVGVLFIPAGFTFLWMTVMGNSALDMMIKNSAPELAAAVDNNIAIALFKFFEYLPFSSVLSVLGVLLIVTFFVSSSDSGSLVIDTLASGGAAEPPVWQRVFWAVTEGVVAATLLLAGGLDALQTMTILSALPLMIVFAIGGLGFLRSLRADYQLMNAVQNHNTVVQYSQATTDWKQRLNSLVTHPGKNEAETFLKENVYPAFNELKKELSQKGFEVLLNDNEVGSLALLIKNGEVEDFLYCVKLRSFQIPDYVPEEGNSYARAEVFLLNGGQDYDVYGYNQEQIIADFITQYERHFHYLHLNNSESFSQ